MSTVQKTALSLLLAVLVFTGFAIAAYSGLFDYIEATFYDPRVQSSVDDTLERALDVRGSYHRATQDRLAAGLNEPAVQNVFRVNQSREDIEFRETYYAELKERMPSFSFVRIVDIEGERLWYSTRDADILRQDDTTRIYRPLVEIDEEYPLTAYLLTPGGVEQDYFVDSQLNQFIYAFILRDGFEIPRGTALFYVDPLGLRNALIRSGIIGAGDVVRLVDDGVILNATPAGAERMAREIEASWARVLDESGPPPVIEYADGAGRLVFSNERDGVHALLLVPESDFVMTTPMRVVLLVASFLTTFLIVFLLLNLRQDALVVLSERVKRFQINFLREYMESKEELDWERWSRELESRREEVRRELKRGVPGIKGAKAQELDELFDKSWDEILNVIAGRRQISRSSEGIDLDRLESIIERMVSNLSTGDDAAAGGRSRAIPQRATATADRAVVVQTEETVPQVSAGAEIDEVEEFEELEEVEEVEEAAEAAEIEAAEDIGELDEAEEIEAAAETEAVEDLEEIEEGSEEVVEAEEIGELGEAEAVAPAGELDEAVEEFEELEELEPIESASEEEVEELVEEASGSGADSVTDTDLPPRFGIEETDSVLESPLTGELIPELDASESHLAIDEQWLDSEEQGLEVSDVEGLDVRDTGSVWGALEDVREDWELPLEMSQDVTGGFNEVAEAEAVDQVYEPDLPGKREAVTEDSRPPPVVDLSPEDDEDLPTLELAEDFDAGSVESEPEEIVSIYGGFTFGLFEFDGPAGVIGAARQSVDEQPSDVEDLEELDENDLADELEELEEIDETEEAGEVEEIQDIDEIEQSDEDAESSMTAREGEASGDGVGNAVEDLSPGSNENYEVVELKTILGYLSQDHRIIEESGGLVQISGQAYERRTSGSDDPVRGLVNLVVRAPDPGTSDESGIDDILSIGGGLDLFPIGERIEARAETSVPGQRIAAEKAYKQLVLDERGLNYDLFLSGFKKNEGGLFKSLIEFTRLWSAKFGAILVEKKGQFGTAYVLGLEDPCINSLKIQRSSPLHRNVLSKRRILMLRRTLQHFAALRIDCSEAEFEYIGCSMFVPIVFRGQSAYVMLGLGDTVPSMELLLEPLAANVQEAVSVSQ